MKGIIVEKYQDYIFEIELITIPQICAETVPKIISLVVSNIKTRRLVSATRKSIEEMLNKIEREHAITACPQNLISMATENRVPGLRKQTENSIA